LAGAGATGSFDAPATQDGEDLEFHVTVGPGGPRDCGDDRRVLPHNEWVMSGGVLIPGRRYDKVTGALVG
jgi:hypothetical protein